MCGGVKVVFVFFLICLFVYVFDLLSVASQDFVLFFILFVFICLFVYLFITCLYSYRHCFFFFLLIVHWLVLSVFLSLTYTRLVYVIFSFA